MKLMDKVKMTHMRQLHRVIIFVVDSKEKGLNLQYEEDHDNKWELKVFSDSDWSGDKDDRHSISGYAIFIGGSLIGWGSKGQCLITL